MRPAPRTPPGARCRRPPPPPADGHRTAGRARRRAHAGHQGVSGPAAAARRAARATARPGRAASTAGTELSSGTRASRSNAARPNSPRLAVPAGPGRLPPPAAAVAGLTQAWQRRSSPQRCRRNARSAGSRSRPAARRRPGSLTATLPQAFRPRLRPARRVASRITSVGAPKGGRLMK